MRLSKILFFLLSFFACSSLYAANGVLPGSGTASSPYLIEDLADFDVFCKTNSYHKSNKYIKLMTDLDLGAKFYTGVVVGSVGNSGYGNPYYYNVWLNFDGNNHIISNMNISGNGFSGGLFSVIDAYSVVKNLYLENVLVRGEFAMDVGGLCGRNFGSIENCHVSGKLDVTKASCSVGLLAGNNYDTGVINYCSAMGTVSHRGYSNAIFTGGLCGSNDCATIMNSYADVDVSGNSYVGSFCGWQGYYSSVKIWPGLIKNCYSKGSATGLKNVGGFIGCNEWSVINCYTTATAEVAIADTITMFGFIGSLTIPGLNNVSSTILNSFWDVDIAQTGDSLYSPLSIRLALEETSGTSVANSGITTRPVITANGDPAWTTDGKIGGALTFDGSNDYMSFVYYGGNIGKTSRTCSVWIKTTATNAQVISTWGAESTGKLWRLMMDADGKYRIAVYGGTKKSSLAINDGQWHHIAVTLPYLNAPTVADTTLYLDGVADIEATVSASQAIDTSNDVSVTIGASVSGTTVSNYFSGTMDDFRIYDISLSASDIARLASLQEPVLDYCVNGLTTPQMQDINTYLNAGWNIVPANQATGNSVWVMAEGQYPKFNWSQPRNDAVFFDTQTLKGMTESDAIAALANAGITAMVKYDCSRLVAAGCVIIPETKDFILRDATELTIVVSTGVYDWSTNPGAGTIDNPYQISTPGMLFGMITDQYYYYELVNDLELKYYSFTNGCAACSDFDADRRFRGFFDGKGHVVRNATISGYYFGPASIYNNGNYQSIQTYQTGFFASIYGPGTIVKNLGVEDINITGSSSSSYVGGFVGVCNQPEMIYNCYSTGNVICYTSSPSYIGGFAGYGYHIESCYSNCKINSNVYYSYANAGGFAGRGSDISNSYSTGQVVGSGDSQSRYAGFIALVSNSNAINNCYAIGKVTSSYSPYGFSSGGYYVNGCFWDYQTSGIGNATSNVLGAKALSTTEMKNANNFIAAGWDFANETANGQDDIWYMPENSYPLLSWQSGVYTLNSSDIKGVTEAGAIAYLDKSGISATVEYDYSNVQPAGKVVAVVGKKLLRAGDSVKLLVSKGAYSWSENGGDGSVTNPWQLSSSGQMFGITADMYDDNFVVTADMDFSYYVLDRCVIGYVGGANVIFSGTIDGRGHCISNVRLNSTYDTSSIGFISLNGGTIKNVWLDNSGIIVKYDNNSSNAGMLCGRNNGYILSSHVTNSLISGDYVVNSVGGLCGYNYGTISGSSAQSVVDSRGFNQVGGFVGTNAGTISGCYSLPVIKLCKKVVGGFCGNSFYGSFSNCYAKGSISSTENVNVSYAAGFCANSSYIDSFNNCYSAVSISLAGYCSQLNGFTNYASVAGYTGTLNFSSCFWDVEASGVGTIGQIQAGATGLSTADMQNVNTFVNAGWDLASDDGDVADWRMPVVGGYPRLYWEMNPDADGSGAVDLVDWSVFAQNWLGTGPVSIIKSDLDGSGAIDLADLEIFAESWLAE